MPLDALSKCDAQQMTELGVRHWIKKEGGDRGDRELCTEPQSRPTIGAG
ncbi:MAG: hypothetical protein ACLFM4_10945 [Phormidium sp.]|nr:MAG: hypothetical protein HLUCCO16_02490 [Phormidium sp. OSCR]